jgi:hypothetical protein
VDNGQDTHSASNFCGTQITSPRGWLMSPADASAFSVELDLKKNKAVGAV